MASVIWQAHCRTYSNFKFSFLGLILTSSAILCLPVLRGYFLYGGNDPYGHFQTIVSIIGSGSFSTDYYPFSHVFAAEIAQITSLPPQTAEGLVMPILSLLFALFIYCLATVVCERRERVLLAAAIGFIPLFSYYGTAFYPEGAALLMLPLAFYLAFKVRYDRGYVPLLIVVLLVFPFLHPLISLVLVFCLFSMFIGEAILKGRGFITRTHLSLTMGLIAAFAWYAWFYVQTAENGFASNVIAWLMGERVLIPRTAELEGANSLGLQGEAVLALKTYGVQIFGCAISVIAIGIDPASFLPPRQEHGQLFHSGSRCDCNHFGKPLPVREHCSGDPRSIFFGKSRLGVDSDIGRTSTFGRERQEKVWGVAGRCNHHNFVSPRGCRSFSLTMDIAGKLGFYVPR